MVLKVDDMITSYWGGGGEGLGLGLGLGLGKEW